MKEVGKKLDFLLEVQLLAVKAHGKVLDTYTQIVTYGLCLYKEKSVSIKIDV